jgi:SAM-dependent methyltransferase
MLRLLPERSERVLDLGCGTGFFLAELEAVAAGRGRARHQPRDAARQRAVRARRAPGDRRRRAPAVRDRSFDAMFCKGSLHHTRDHVRFLSNCARALRPDGVLIMSEPCNDNFLIRWARAAMYRISPHFHPDDRGFTKDELVGLMERAGFELVYAGRYGVPRVRVRGLPRPHRDPALDPRQRVDRAEDARHRPLDLLDALPAHPELPGRRLGQAEARALSASNTERAKIPSQSNFFGKLRPASTALPSTQAAVCRKNCSGSVFSLARYSRAQRHVSRRTRARVHPPR